ncbi:MAG: single-stranded DNA-binding protein [Chloroflexi bacterium]|nr:single-stranded DNA-binding protein [Chloroflexota bacterium]
MYQRIIVVGNLGRDPELRYTQSGQAVCHFTMATSRKWSGQDGQPKEETTWFRVSVWGKQAETANQYLTKGQKVLVEGRVSAQAFMGNDGQPRASLEISADAVRFLGGGQGTGPGQGQADAGDTAPPSNEDEIPF